jgi:hypothetical protein
VDSFAHVINTLLQLLVRLGDIIVGGIVTLELWTRDQLAQFGLAPQVQTVIMLAIAVVLILLAFRLFGGLIRVAVVLVLILIALHIVMPVLQH